MTASFFSLQPNLYNIFCATRLSHKTGRRQWLRQSAVKPTDLTSATLMSSVSHVAYNVAFVDRVAFSGSQTCTDWPAIGVRE